MARLVERFGRQSDLPDVAHRLALRPDATAVFQAITTAAGLDELKTAVAPEEHPDRSRHREND